jgi:hypothetical protein
MSDGVDTFRQASYDPRTVAVTVTKRMPFVVLDEEDLIVGVGPHAESQFGPLVGTRMWDCFPGSEPLFKPYYDTARRTGAPVEFVQFYDGNVARVRAVPVGEGRLELEWEQLARLDTLTLVSLSDTLDDALQLLGEPRSVAGRKTAAGELRVIEGGQ